MDKNIKLSNIYIKIHNHRCLTMDDLKYLAQYDPECFEKTCHNVVYNIPEAKHILRPNFEIVAIEQKKEEVQARKIDLILENIRSMEIEEVLIEGLSVDRVKELLGELYMEKVFPHSEKMTYFDIRKEELEGTFNKKV